MGSRTKRLQKELEDFHKSDLSGVSVNLANDDLHIWQVSLVGPPDTPYEGGTFGILIRIPVDFPFRAPTARFTTRIYHPNITNDNLGNICLGLLKSENWKPNTKLSGIIEALRNLLIEPQPDDPLESRIADEYRNQRGEYEKIAREHTSRYASGQPEFNE